MVFLLPNFVVNSVGSRAPDLQTLVLQPFGRRVTSKIPSKEGTEEDRRLRRTVRTTRNQTSTWCVRDGGGSVLEEEGSTDTETQTDKEKEENSCVGSNPNPGRD